MKTRSIFLTTIFVVFPAIIFLIWLGVWQVQRLQWKTSLIETREENFEKDPLILPARDYVLERTGWRRVEATGTFDHLKEFHLWSIRDGAAGFEVLTPLSPIGYRAAPILVDRGWVPSDLKNPATRLSGQIEGEVTITGYIRTDLDIPQPYTLENEPENNIWYIVDYIAMGNRDQTLYRPGILIADDAPNLGGWPLGISTIPSIRNNHLSYAVTWFSLALSAGIIWVLTIRRRRRQ